MLLAAQALGSEHLPVAFLEELSPHWLSSQTGVERMTASDDQIIAVGELSLGKDGIGGISRVAMRFPDGSIHPLRIEKPTIIYEFGQLVFCRFAVNIPITLIAQSGFALEYGEDVSCDNVLVENIHLDPAESSRYREISLGPPARTNADTESQELSLRVMADRQGRRKVWLYLLPIALVLVATVLRALTGKKKPV